ncbi:MAG TPA: c-type cytochrome [Rhodanobacteraceae bacterium]|nr:c-type cytochrome [Rhodanobacteraceae bacterium]
MLRMLKRILFAIVALVLAIALFVYARSELALHATWTVDEPALALPDDADALARGEHLAVTRGCTDCHAKDFGGRTVMESPPIGRMSGPNLTHGKGGLSPGFSDRDFERAIRHGLKPDGRALLFMPTRDFAGLSNADTAALIAYLEKQPPVDRENAPSYIGPIGRALFAFGQLPMLEARLVDQHAAHPAAIVPAATAEYGRYVAESCTGCHGMHFSGGAIPGVPPDFPKPANITPDVATGIGKWTKDDFYRVFREGKKPDGSPIDPFMPWQAMGRFTDTELDALWAYLRGVPARPYGER